MSKNRQICFAVLVQSIRTLSKTIKMNCSVFQLAKFRSKKVVLNDIYEEVSNIFTVEKFKQLYDYAREKPFGSLITDTTNGNRFLSNLDSELFINDEKPKN